MYANKKNVITLTKLNSWCEFTKQFNNVNGLHLLMLLLLLLLFVITDTLELQIVNFYTMFCKKKGMERIEIGSTLIYLTWNEEEE